MGILDFLGNIKMADEDSPEYAKAIGYLTAGQTMTSPSKGSEFNKILNGILAGLKAKTDYKTALQQQELSERESAANARYRDMLTKKIESEMGHENMVAGLLDTPTPMPSTEQVQIGTNEDGTPMLTEQQTEKMVPYWQTLGNKGMLLKAALLGKTSLPGELLQDFITQDVDGQKVQMTRKELVDYLTGQKDEAYKRQLDERNYQLNKRRVDIEERRANKSAADERKTTSTDQGEIKRQLLTKYKTSPSTKLGAFELSDMEGQMTDEQMRTYSEIYDDAVEIYSSGKAGSHNEAVKKAIDNWYRKHPNKSRQTKTNESTTSSGGRYKKVKVE